MIPAKISSLPCSSPEMRGSSCHKPVDNHDNNDDDGDDYFDHDHDDYFDNDDHDVYDYFDVDDD